MKNYTLLYKVRVGSHAYGMNTPASDEDYAGIFLPELKYFFGLESFDQVVDQTEEDDTALYSLRKYASLAYANNPNVMELMFVDDSDKLYVHPAIEPFLAIRKSFLSQRCAKTYLGYAGAQLHRIRSHQKWIAQELGALDVLLPLIEKGKITKDWVEWRFGKNMISRLGDVFKDGTKTADMDQHLDSLRSFGIVCPDENDEKYWTDHPRKGKVYQRHIYDQDKKQRDQYVTWMAERNPIRHELEAKFGYDTKHGAHLVRLLRCGYEILTTGELAVRRPDAKELLAIRQGGMAYGDLVAYADEMINKVNSLTSFAVPEKPNHSLINEQILSISRELLLRPFSVRASF